jgi:hypothetical protein
MPTAAQRPKKISKWYRPWEPFPTRPDFEVAAMFNEQNMSLEAIEAFLKAMGLNSGVRGSTQMQEHSTSYSPPYVWHLGRSHITMDSVKTYHSTMEKARAQILTVGTISCILLYADQEIPVEDKYNHSDMAWQRRD